MGRIIAYATPVFFAMIAIEYFVGRARGRNNYRLNDAVNSLSLGVMSQVVGLFTRALTIGIYAVVYSAVAVRQLPADQWWVWLLGIVSYDFCYYWFHRVGHESAVFWASHVVHHQSQEYNLSTALRQTSSSALLGWIFYLPMAIAASARSISGGGGRQPAVPVLDPHRADRLARMVRPLVLLALESPRPPRRQQPLHRPQLRRHLHGLGPPVRHLRRRDRALRLRHARAARLVGPVLGERRGLRRSRAQVLERRSMARQVARVADAARLAASRRPWSSLAEAALRSEPAAPLRPADDARQGTGSRQCSLSRC